jgi:ornithine carbamoyltransferase
MPTLLAQVVSSMVDGIMARVGAHAEVEARLRSFFAPF